jgi:hypothetical protein
MSSGAEEDLTNGTSAPALRREAAQRQWLRYLPALAVALMLFRFRVRIFIAPLPLNDFLFYWTGAKLFLAHADPYSMTAMTVMERSLGWTHEPVALLYPPWVLPLIAGFGMFPFHAVHAGWRLICMVIEAASVLALWRYFGGSRRSAWIALAVLATFLPAASAEQMAQLTPLILGGFTVFLLLLKRNAFATAGITLLLLSLKPHLMYLVVAAVILWAIQERRWALLAGAAGAFAAVTAAALSINPLALGYFQSAHPALDISCGVGGVLREVFGMEHRWLQFLPTGAGAVWLAIHWRRHRHAWQWEEQVPLLLLVSLVMAPYSWAHDFVLALPALIALAVKLYDSGSDWTVAAALYGAAQIIIFAYLQDAPKPWQSLACALWLVVYLVALPTAADTEATVELLEQPA